MFRATLRAGIFVLIVLYCGAAFALPMKPDIKVLLEEAKRPQDRFVPARAGWNGPEEKAAVVEPNATYEAMRAERSPAEMRRRFLASALPDWRVVIALGALIVMLRSAKASKPRRLAQVIAFPTPAPAMEEAA